MPGLPHHITQRGNRREPVFFEDDDYRLYRRLIAKAARHAGAAVWAYCLMPNHVHLIVTPADEDGLRATFAEAHRRYTGAINARFRWTGHLFQGRFGAVVMDEPHLLAAARYIALNPVVAGLVRHAEDWRWSSARAQLAGEDDELTTAAPLRALIPDFAALLATPADPATTTRIERAPTIGRPLGARNGSRSSSAVSAALWHPANPAQSREWSETSGVNRSCCENSSKLSPQPRHRNPQGARRRDRQRMVVRHHTLAHRRTQERDLRALDKGADLVLGARLGYALAHQDQRPLGLVSAIFC